MLGDAPHGLETGIKDVKQLVHGLWADTPNEVKLVNMEFAEDLDGDTIASIISVVFVPTGPTFTTAISGTKAQVKLTGGMQAGTRYRCTMLIQSTTNSETFEGHGWLDVA